MPLHYFFLLFGFLSAQISPVDDPTSCQSTQYEYALLHRYFDTANLSCTTCGTNQTPATDSKSNFN